MRSGEMFFEIGGSAFGHQVNGNMIGVATIGAPNGNLV